MTFGVRTVTVDPRKGLRINGEPVLLRGACIHSDNGPLGAAAIGRAEERRIELLKAAGFNAIRSAHNPASPRSSTRATGSGMLVMDEAFDMWTRFKTPYDYAADFPQWWAADLESMVAKDRNHPSVIMYSIGNEIIEVGTPHGAALGAPDWRSTSARSTPRAWSPTASTRSSRCSTSCRSLLAAGERWPQRGDGRPGDGVDAHLGRATPPPAARRSPAPPLDVLGLNYADGRYALDRDLFPHRVIVGSETFPSQIGRLWPLVLANPNVIGDFTWTGWDYLGEVGIGATAYAEDPDAVPALEREYPYLTAWCGDLDITGWRRPVSYYREIVFGLRTEPYIAVLRPEHHGHTITDAVAVGVERHHLLLDLAGVTRAALSRSRSTRTPTRSPCCSTAPRSRAARSAASVRCSPRSRPSTGPGARRRRVPGRRRGRPRTSLPTAGRRSSPRPRTARASATTTTDLAFVAIELRDAAGARHLGATPRHGRGERRRGARRHRQRQPEDRGALRRADLATFDGRALAVVTADRSRATCS